jgi:23S rRNA (uracil1939-C5)-methyltransferase
MEKRLFKKNEDIELRISDMAFGGVGIAKIETPKGEFAVFVQNTIPGQLVSARVEKCDKRYAICKLLDILEESPDEVKIPYQPIPGAPYATLPIELQHTYKKRTTLELFKRIGKIEDIESLLDAFISSPSAWHYRNKMEYSFSAIRFDLDEKKEMDDFGLGFKHRGTWWSVENLDKDSGLFDEEFENLLKGLRTWAIDSKLPPWHPPKREGFYRFLVARKSFLTNQLLLNLVTSDQGLDIFDVEAFGEVLKKQLGNRLAGFIHTVNPDIGDRVEPLNGSSKLVFGESKIVEEILGLKFEISMTSFFQTNPRSAELLYSKVIDYVVSPGLNNDGFILDLFCGTGTIGQLIARKTEREVIGVDIIESAIEDAALNAERNSINNVRFHAADVGKFLLEFPEYQNKISCVVLDPPRGGIAPKTLRKVIALGAPRIVYVSCNPSTQARDAIELYGAGYTLKKISLVDQFPHTSHIETVTIFERV